jgi:beta-glucosidase
MKIAKKIIFAVALTATSVAGAAAANAVPEQAKMNAFIDKLMSQMTTHEKIGQLNLPVTGDIVTGQAKSSDVSGKIRNGEVGGLFNLKGVKSIREIQRVAVEESRLHIPLLFGMDVIHGYETAFPIPLALSCSWDMDAIQESARIAALEASADGICWTFSPMVDICRDPRWGRMAEGAGEDPYLGSQVAAAMVKGYQGADLKDKTSMMACVKHFALYGASEAGRDYNTVDMSRVRMYNEYLPPYKAAVDAGAGSIMSSFNEIDGVPATGNKWLLTDLLRNQWGFKGFVVTDYTAIMEMMAHGMGDLQQVSALALNAGTDMDMVSEGFVGTVEKSLQEGKVTMDAINTACRRILEAKYKLGLFDDPYRYCDPKRAAKDINLPTSKATAEKIATETFVLLKNEGNLLPLQRTAKIALIGPLADSKANMAGTWSVAAELDKTYSVFNAMKQAVGDKGQVTYAKGCNLMRDSVMEANATMFGRGMRDGRSEAEMNEEAMKIARDADVIVAAMGESSEMSGECSCRTNLDLPDCQRALLEKLVALGKPVVLLNFSGRATTLTWENAHIPAIMNVWFGGSEAAKAICDVVFGDVAPSGKLSMTMPKSVGQIPLYYNHKNTGRPLEKGKWFTKFRSNYLDIDNDPLYPFGYGLSYTKFDYSGMALSGTAMDQNGKITATVTVTNNGNFDGDEVVQLYIRDMVGSITRPVKELKGFKRIHLAKGESQTVSFDITPETLKFYNSDLKLVCEPGEFQVMIGGDSENVITKSFTLR